jgi:hypothetical protein
MGHSTVVLFALLIGAPLVAQVPTGRQYTLRLLNGYFWTGKLSDDAKASYLLGYADMQAATAYLPCKIVPGELTVFEFGVKGRNIREIREALDRFYSVRQNLNLPIRWALRLTAMKAAGKHAADIEAETVAERELVAPSEPHLG